MELNCCEGEHFIRASYRFLGRLLLDTSENDHVISDLGGECDGKPRSKPTSSTLQSQPQPFWGRKGCKSPAMMLTLAFKSIRILKVGLVGRTGAGKSTLASLLLRVVEPSKGKVKQISGFV